SPFKKGIESLEKRKEEHEEKIKIYSGKDDTLVDYWKGEIKGFEEEIAKKFGKLKRNLKKKN
ncbi:unnamed protein product, partial [marine sediment metagenome]